jgi:GNAT superfamily N-acetyltransferase
MTLPVVVIQRNPRLSDTLLNELFEVSWPDHRERSFAPVLERSLVTIGAFAGERLVGFVNVAWDGGVHGFVLDTTVHPDFRRRGIALSLLQEVARVASDHKLEWLHADFVPELEPLYQKAGYHHTEAGLLKLGGAA